MQLKFDYSITGGLRVLQICTSDLLALQIMAGDASTWYRSARCLTCQIGNNLLSSELSKHPVRLRHGSFPSWFVGGFVRTWLYILLSMRVQPFRYAASGCGISPKKFRFGPVAQVCRASFAEHFFCRTKAREAMEL